MRMPDALTNKRHVCSRCSHMLTYAHATGRVCLRAIWRCAYKQTRLCFCLPKYGRLPRGIYIKVCVCVCVCVCACVCVCVCVCAYIYVHFFLYVFFNIRFSALEAKRGGNPGLFFAWRKSTQKAQPEKWKVLKKLFRLYSARLYSVGSRLPEKSSTQKKIFEQATWKGFPACKQKMLCSCKTPLTTVWKS